MIQNILKTKISIPSVSKLENFNCFEMLEFSNILISYWNYDHEFSTVNSSKKLLYFQANYLSRFNINEEFYWRIFSILLCNHKIGSSNLNFFNFYFNTRSFLSFPLQLKMHSYVKLYKAPPRQLSVNVLFNSFISYSNESSFSSSSCVFY